MKDAKFSFKTTILQSGKTATGIVIPDKIIEQLGAGKKPPVKVTINGYTYQSTVATMNGAYMVGVSAVVREKAGVNGGDKISVIIELDTQLREVEVPAELQKALNKNKEAKKFFETLSNSNKKRYTLPIEQAKTEETRTRRIEKAIVDLANGVKL